MKKAAGRASGSSNLFAALHRLGYRVAYQCLRLWWWMRRPDKQSAAVALWHGERLLLVRTSYRPGWSLPAGGMGRHEAPVAAACRELFEETGISLPADSLSAAQVFQIRHENRRDTIHVFERRFQDEPAISIDQREIVAAGFFDPEERSTRDLLAVVRLYLEKQRSS